MAPPYHERNGATLNERLRSRRDRLPDAARRFYELLAREAEVHGTDQDDRVQTVRDESGNLEVRLGTTEGEPYFVRRYQPDETSEVRLFLKDGDDRVVSGGNGSSSIKVRVVGGDGNDVLDDSGGGHTRFYDSAGENHVTRGPGTKSDERPYESPTDEDGNPDRDWGSMTLVQPWLRAGEELGVLLGAELAITKYGFRKHPYDHRHSLRAGYSTRLSAVRAEYEWSGLRIGGEDRFHVLARASGLELLHFHGFGNETELTAPESFYDVKQPQFSLYPSYRLDVSAVDVSVGPVFKFATTRLDDGNFIAALRPYGVGDYGQLGARARLALDRRDHVRFPKRGVYLSADGTYYPKAWSVDDHFAVVNGQAAVYASADVPVLEPTLALRVGGTRVFGRYPYHEAAYIGGPETVRGLLRQRYAGDSSLYGNAELRMAVARIEAPFPLRFGVLGLVDTGRVFLEGESSRRWHTAVGGGIWISAIDPAKMLSVSLAWSEGRVGVSVRGGFMF
jgi:hypothetical protein